MIVLQVVIVVVVVIIFMRRDRPWKGVVARLLNALAWHNKSSGKISRKVRRRPVAGSMQLF